MLMILVLILFHNFIVCQRFLGLTRTSFYEEPEAFSIAKNNDEIPENLKYFFKFEDQTLIVKTSEGRSIGFMIARKDPYDILLAEWCSPSFEEFENCNDDINLCSITILNKWPDIRDVCSNQMASAYLLKSGDDTFFSTDIRMDKEPFYSSKPNTCYHINDENNTDPGDTYPSYLRFIYENDGITKKMIQNTEGLFSSGLLVKQLPHHEGWYQSGRIANGIFCGKPFRFPDAWLLYQNITKGKRIEIDYSETIIEPMAIKVLETTTATTSPKLLDLKIGYLFAIVCGSICGVIILCSLLAGIAFWLIRRKQKKNFNSDPSFSSYQLLNEPHSIHPFENHQNLPLKNVDINLSARPSKASVNKNPLYSRLLNIDFVKEKDDLPPQAYNTKILPITPFLSEEFKNVIVPSGPKSADKLLREALEQPFIEDRSQKLLQAVAKANNELFSLGFRRKLEHRSSYHVTAPSASRKWLKDSKENDFLQFIISSAEKDIGGSDGEFEDNPKLWKSFLDKIDVPETFRHACFFGQSIKRQHFFIMATYYKMALLIAENPNKNVLLSMAYPIPMFVTLCERNPHYFEIHDPSLESASQSSKKV